MRRSSRIFILSSARDDGAPRPAWVAVGRAALFLAFWLMIAGYDPVDLPIGLITAAAATWASLRPPAGGESAVAASVAGNIRAAFPASVGELGRRSRLARVQSAPAAQSRLRRLSLPPAIGRHAKRVLRALESAARARCRPAPTKTARSSSTASTSASPSRPIWPRKKRCSAGRSAMTEFLLAAAGFILLTVAVGLLRILGGPGNVDRTMAAQLLGTGGIAALLLVAAATGVRGVGGCRPGACPSRRLRLRRLRQQRRAAGRLRRIPNERRRRHLHHRRDLRRRRLLPGGHRGLAALSRLRSPACTP